MLGLFVPLLVTPLELVAYYMEMQEQYRDRLIQAPQGRPANKSAA